MIRDQHDIFVDFREATYIFEQHMRDDNAETAWPLLPILTLVGPAGWGKSMFMRHLYFHYCNVPRHHPHATLDFKDHPRDLLNILGALRDNLQYQRDEQGHMLQFPRFNIIYNLLKKTEGQKEEENDKIDLLGNLSDVIGLVGQLYIPLAALLFALKFIAQIPPVHSFIQKLVAWMYQRAGGRPEWQWYQDQVQRFRELNLPANASISDILKRLHDMCLLGRPEREFLIEQILSKAFLADLRYGSYDKEPWYRSDPSKRSQGPRRVVIFLDSFEVLLRNAESLAKHLLEVLALNEYRKRGENDPLLLVVSSEVSLPDMSRKQLNQHFFLALHADTRPMQQRADDLGNDWQNQLPAQDDRRTMGLKNLYLPLPLSAFSLDATREYLLKLDQRDGTQCFTEVALIQDIHRETQGYPIFLERVAAALRAPQQEISTIEELYASDEHGEQFVDRLLALHCKQIEVRNLMLSAIPRRLTPELLRLILNLPDDQALKAEWRRYRHLPFLLSSEDKQEQHAILLPGIRALFLRKLYFSSTNSASDDYTRIHRLLRDHFRKICDVSCTQQSLLEHSYHSLALGEYEPVVELACAKRHEPALLEKLLEVIGQAPLQQLPRTDVEQRAEEALNKARLHDDIKGAVCAIVLYAWLLASPGSDPRYIRWQWLNMEAACNHLQRIDPNTPQDMAQRCNQRVRELQDVPRLPHRLQAATPRGPAIVPQTQLTQRVLRLTDGFGRLIFTNPVALRILVAVLLLATIIPFLLPHITWQSAPPSIENPFNIPVDQLEPSDDNQWIGAIIKHGEWVGLSDGTIPFDYLRPDASQKIQAVKQLRDKNLQEARNALQKALKEDINDPEASIYLQNTQIHLSHKDCTVFIVATSINEDATQDPNNGRDNLQGAYVAQQEYNEKHPDAVCLYIANLGSNARYASDVAQQIVKAAAANTRIKGLIGWHGILDSRASLRAVHLLQGAHLPIISPDGYNEQQIFSNVSDASNVFHIASPYQNQGRKGALYAEQYLHKSRAAVIFNAKDVYSSSLMVGFKGRFEQDGNQIVFVPQDGHASIDKQALATMIAEDKPDFIYFAGGLEEGRVLLAQLHDVAPTLPIIGGDELYPFVGFSVNTRPDFTQLAFTCSAYPDASVAQDMLNRYALDFDVGDTGHVHGYGYSRPDDQAILSYDAMATLMGAEYAAEPTKSDLQVTLSSYTNIKGASREQIAFTTSKELKDKSLFVLSADRQGHIGFKVL